MTDAITLDTVQGYYLALSVRGFEAEANLLKTLFHEREAARAQVAQARREGIKAAEDAAHDAAHYAIYEMGECVRVQEAVTAAIRALLLVELAQQS